MSMATLAAADTQHVVLRFISMAAHEAAECTPHSVARNLNGRTQKAADTQHVLPRFISMAALTAAECTARGAAFISMAVLTAAECTAHGALLRLNGCAHSSTYNGMWCCVPP